MERIRLLLVFFVQIDFQTKRISLIKIFLPVKTELFHYPFNVRIDLLIKFCIHKKINNPHAFGHNIIITTIIIIVLVAFIRLVNGGEDALLPLFSMVRRQLEAHLDPLRAVLLTFDDEVGGEQRSSSIASSFSGASSFGSGHMMR